MSTLGNLIEANGHATPADIEWLHLLLADLTFIAVVELSLAALSTRPAALQLSLESAAS